MNYTKKFELIFMFFVLLCQFEAISGVEAENFPTLTQAEQEAFAKIIASLNNEISTLRNETAAHIQQFKNQFQHQIMLQIQKIDEIQQSIKQLQNFRAEMLAQPDNCATAMRNSDVNDGIYLLNISGSGLQPFQVNCQRHGNEIWTVIQRREDGSENFYRRWFDYKNGFGKLNGEFWLGLERVYQMIKRQPHELKIWMAIRKGEEKFARYKKFEIGNEAEKYALNVDDFSGNADDVLKSLNGMKFSTRDNDNDEKEIGSCAVIKKGAWWFKDCAAAHLNGPYNENDDYGIFWFSVGTNLQFSQMAIRRLN